MRRTLLITQHFPPAIGGAEEYLKTLARGLAPADLVVIAPPADGDAVFDQAQPYRVIRRNLLLSRWLRPSWLAHAAWLIRMIRRERIERVVFGHYAGFVPLGLIARWLTATPYIVSVLGLDFTAYRRTFIRRVLLRLALRQADWVTTISEFSRRLLVEFGVPKGKIVLSQPGLTTARIMVSRDAARQSLRLPPDAFCLLTVGRLVKRKGHLRVIRSLPDLLQRVPSVKYIIIGEGPYRATLEQAVRELKLETVVRFLGSVSDQTRAAAYSASDVFTMLPSDDQTDPEGFGIVYLEAMQSGLPLVATANGGVADIIRDQQNGLVIERQSDDRTVANACERLFRDQTLYQRLGRQGKIDVEQRFTSERQVAPFLTILEKTLPRVSVVIPIFNNALVIARTLHSLKVQSHSNLEIIVVDDGSHDHPETAVQRFPGVQFIRREHAGAPAARNAGAQVSTSEFILFCDADVILHPRMIERLLLALLLNPQAAYAYCNFKFGWRTFDLFDFNASKLQTSNYISMMSLIRRTAFPGFDESIQRLQDWDLWLTMLERGQTGTWVPARLFSASIGKQGISRKIQAPPLAAVQRIREKHRLA